MVYDPYSPNKHLACLVALDYWASSAAVNGEMSLDSRLPSCLLF